MRRTGRFGRHREGLGRDSCSRTTRRAGSPGASSSSARPRSASRSSVAGALLAACGGDDEEARRRRPRRSRRPRQPPADTAAAEEPPAEEPAGEPVAGGQLIEGYDRDFTRMDPVLTTWDDPAFVALYEFTVVRDAEGGYQPALVRLVGGLGRPAHLDVQAPRRASTFQSGAPLDAQMIADNFNAFRDATRRPGRTGAERDLLADGRRTRRRRDADDRRRHDEARRSRRSRRRSRPRTR